MMNRFIVVGLLYTFIYVLATYKLDPAIKASLMYPISWLVLFVFIYVAIPIFIYFPWKSMKGHVKNLKEHAINNLFERITRTIKY